MNEVLEKISPEGRFVLFGQSFHGETFERKPKTIRISGDSDRRPQRNRTLNTLPTTSTSIASIKSSSKNTFISQLLLVVVSMLHSIFQLFLIHSLLMFGGRTSATQFL